MTFGSDLKPNEFGVVNGHVESQLKLYGGLAQLLAEKASAEKEYGRKLMELSRNFQSQLSSINNSKNESANRDSMQSSNQEESTGNIELFPAASKWALYLEGEGNLHLKLAASISSKVVNELQRDIGSLDSTRKQNLEFYHRLLTERDTVYALKDSMKEYFDSRSKILATTQHKLERATSEKELEKLRKMAVKHKAKCNHAKNEYILQVAKANAIKNAINHQFTPQIMNSMQAIDEQRVAVIKRLLLQFMEAQTSIHAKMVSNARETIKVLNFISPKADSQMFVYHRLQSGASKWDELQDFRVVVDKASGDTDHMPLDGESQVILRNLFIDSRLKSENFEAEAREKLQVAEKIRQRILSGVENCEKEIDNAATAERQAILAQFEIIQSQALCAMIEKHLGHVDSGCPHNFKQTSVTISKTCDCCNKSIGGLKRKAARCIGCDYLCHANCQIKVEPNCPGRDTNAKKGFLSIFKRKNLQKKVKNIQAQTTAMTAGAETTESAETVADSINSEDFASSASILESAPVPVPVPAAAAAAGENMPNPIPKSTTNLAEQRQDRRLSTAPNLRTRSFYGTADRNAVTTHTAPSQAMTYQQPSMPLYTYTLAPSCAMQSPPALGSAFTQADAAAAENNSASGIRPLIAKNSDFTDTYKQETLFELTSRNRNQSTPLPLREGNRSLVNMSRISVSNVIHRDSSIQGFQPNGMVSKFNSNINTNAAGLAEISESNATTTIPYTLQQRLQLQLQQLRQLQQPPSTAAGISQPIFTTEISDSESEISLDEDDGHEYVVALFDFAGRSAEELTFAAGDRIRVVSRDIGGGWMRGTLNGHEGRLPRNYIKTE